MLSRRVASLCVLTVLTACATAPATEPLQRASCVLRIEFDGNGSSAQVAQTVQAALTSTALVDPSMQAALEMGPAEWPKFVQVDVQPAGDVAVKLGIVVRSTPEKTLPPGSAEKVMREITQRVVRSFNDTPEPKDDRAKQIEALQAERVEIDKRLAVVRVEINRANQLVSMRDHPNRAALRPGIEQELHTVATETAVQQATIQAIDEELKKLEADKVAELNDLRVKLLNQRVEVRIRLAQNRTRQEMIERRLADLLRETPTTNPAEQLPVLQNEQMELNNRRNIIEQKISNLSNQRSNQPPKPKLVILDGSGK